MKDPIVVLGPGRCGSTLIQRILNTSENITIWGEHEGFLSKLAESYYVLTESEGMKKNFYSQPIDPSILIGSLTDYQACPNWINSFDKNIIKHTYRSMIAQLLNNQLDIEKNFWGFKEIRYTQHDSALNMWLELFPASYLIFSVRNPFNVVSSMILDWNNPQIIQALIDEKNIERLKQIIIRYAMRWNKVVASFPYWIEKKKLDCYVEKYEDLLADSQSTVKKMFNFLHLPMPDTALSPVSVKVGSSRTPCKSEIQEIIYSMKEDIWQIVGSSAEYFEYDIESVNSFIA
jgi:hypothetical protein